MAIIDDTSRIEARKHEQVCVDIQMQAKHPLGWPASGVELSIWPRQGSESSSDAFKVLVNVHEAQVLYGKLGLAIMDLVELTGEPLEGE